MRPGRQKAGIAAAPEKARALQEMKNRGNEAKNPLKRKEVAFLSAANCGCFCTHIDKNCASRRAITPVQDESQSHDGKPATYELF